MKRNTSQYKKIQKVCRPRRAAAIRHFDMSPFARNARYCLLGFVFGVCALGITSRLFYLQGTTHDKWERLALRQHEGTQAVLGARGTIFDRNRRSLATSAETLSVGLHPHLIGDKESAAKALASELSLDAKTVAAKLASEKKFVWLAKGVSIDKEPALRAISSRGLSIQKAFSRFYPQGSIAASLVGKLGADGDGLSGIELAFNDQLQARKIERAIRRDALGNLFTPTSYTPGAYSEKGDRQTTVREEGRSLVLTIDAVFQNILEREVERGRLNAEAKGVYAALMDAETGEVLAAAQDVASDSSNGLSSLRNGILQNVYEPGSTFKPLVAAVALDGGFANTREEFDCQSGRLRVGRHLIRDVHPIKKERVTLRDILVQSSNVGMAELGRRMGRERLHAALKSLGFGEKTGVELRGEAKGIVRPVEGWRTIDVATASFGQGIAVSALQLLRGYAVLANGGYLVEPTIVVQANQEPRRQRVLKAETAATISEMIAGVVHDEHGTARKARIAGVTVYGKTGTAQKPSKTSRGYDPDAVLSSFIGYVDGTQVGVSKKLVLYVAVDEPQVRPRWGGRVAAPVFKRAMERFLSHLISTQATVASRNLEKEKRIAYQSGSINADSIS